MPGVLRRDLHVPGFIESAAPVWKLRPENPYFLLNTTVIIPIAIINTIIVTSVIAILLLPLAVIIYPPTQKPRSLGAKPETTNPKTGFAGVAHQVEMLPASSRLAGRGV